MVLLNRIYTKTGDAGTTALGSGERVPKTSLRIAAYGTVDETNAQLGMVRLHLAGREPDVDAMLVRVQNDLFDLGADLCVPDRGEKLPYEPLRVSDVQVKRLEDEIDLMNATFSSRCDLSCCRAARRRARRCMSCVPSRDAPNG